MTTSEAEHRARQGELDDDRQRAEEWAEEQSADPMLLAVQEELYQLDSEELLAGTDDPDRRMVHTYGRFCQRRLNAIQRIKDYAAKMIPMLEAQIQKADFLRWRAGEAVARLTEGRKAKSVKTPFGTMGFRRRGAATAEWDKHDDDAVMQFCEQHYPSAIQQHEPTTPKPTILKEVLGQLLSNPASPQCSIVSLKRAGEDEFYYKPPKERTGDGDAKRSIPKQVAEV